MEARRGSELGLERVKIGDLRAEVVGARLDERALDVAASASAPLAATAVAAGGAAPTARRMRASSAARSRCISSYTITWATGRRPSSRAIWSTLVWLFCDVRARRRSASVGTTSRRTARLVVAWLTSPWHDVRKNETACLMRLVRTIASTVSRGSSATSERRWVACAPPIAPKETPLARHGGRASDAFGQPPAQRLPRRCTPWAARRLPDAAAAARAQVVQRRLRRREISRRRRRPVELADFRVAQAVLELEEEGAAGTAPNAPSNPWSPCGSP